MIAILRRFEEGGRTYRVLDCGKQHAVVEPHRARADATHVRQCQRCAIDLVRPTPKEPLGKCGAIVMNPKKPRTHLCGRDAFELKRGRPRCPLHLRRGAR